MAKILGIKTLNLSKRFHIVKVEMDFADPNSDVDYCSVESMVDTNPFYSGFRFIAGIQSPVDTYCTYWLCSLEPRYGITNKDLKMYKDIIYFTQY